MLCPACSAPLAQADVPDAMMFLCARCGGAWLDNAASAQVAAGALSRGALGDAYEIGQRAGDPQGGGYRSPDRGTSERRCPVCRQPLESAYVGHATTHLDICRAHGTFFDRHELVAVNTAFESEKLSADARRRSLASIIKKSRPSRSGGR
jgi:Zn-finger nucleic acid-binding protein